MRYLRSILCILALGLFSFPGLAQERPLDNVFYCFNNGVRGLPNAPETLEGQAALIKKLGYDGLAGHSTQDNLELRVALDKEDLLMPEVYYGMTLDSAGNITYPEVLDELIRASNGRDMLIALTLHAKQHQDRKDEADKLLIPEIRKLADFAAQYGVGIALYPHIWFHLEESMHALELAKEVNHPNVGLIFNTCHFLRVEGEEGWREKVEKSMPYIRMVSINGADSGDTRNMDWDQLIQPLGEGSFDTYALVSFLKNRGYDGLFGLQCYGIKQDSEVALGTSISTWRSYQKRYLEEQKKKVAPFEQKLGGASVSFDGKVLKVGTGEVERSWEWTGRGFRTTSLKNQASGKEWAQADPEHEADWDLPTKISSQTYGQLISVSCKETDDEHFTSPHLLVTALVEYDCGIRLKYLVRVYPWAPGFWTALEIKALDYFSAEGIPEDLGTYKSYGSRQPVKIARAEYIPVDFQQKSDRFYWGIYNDPGNRVNTKGMVREEVKSGWPLFQDEQNTWASGLAVTQGTDGLIMVKESNKTVNKYGHQTGSFFCTPEGLEVTGWGLKPEEIKGEFRRTWANWSILYEGSKDEMELALKRFDRIRYPVDLERDMHILIDTWGSDHQNGQDDKIYGRENSVFDVVAEEVRTASRMGIDIVRIDDGWQHGSPFQKGVYSPWEGAGYSPHWAKLRPLADEYNVRIGLWAAIRFISPEEMRKNQQELNVATWKLDFDRLPDWEAFHNRMQGIREFIKDSDYKTQLSWCPEYDDQRYGWYSPAKECGPMYFQNIQNNLPNHIVYVPYITLMGHWNISRYYNMNKLQCHWQNPALTNPEFSDAPLHSQSYAAMSAFMAVPSCFMLTQLLEDEQEKELTEIIGLYKEHRKEIFEGYVFPFGEEPNNDAWTGFQIYHPDKKTGYLMVFRELHNQEVENEMKLRFFHNESLVITDLEDPDRSPGKVKLKEGAVNFNIDQAADYRFYKYEIK